METKENNKGLIVLIFILALLFFGLGGYIVYDKVLNKSENTSNNNNSNKEYFLNSNNSNQEYIFKHSETSKNLGLIKLENKEYEVSYVAREISYDGDILKIGNKEISWTGGGEIGIYILPNTLLIRITNNCEETTIELLDFDLNTKYEKDNYYNIDNEFINWQHGYIKLYQFIKYAEGACIDLAEYEMKFNFANNTLDNPTFVKNSEKQYCSQYQIGFLFKSHTDYQKNIMQAYFAVK